MALAKGMAGFSKPEQYHAPCGEDVMTVVHRKIKARNTAARKSAPAAAKNTGARA